jgi:hypothetical protein
VDVVFVGVEDSDGAGRLQLLKIRAKKIKNTRPNIKDRLFFMAISIWFCL